MWECGCVREQGCGAWAGWHPLLEPPPQLQARAERRRLAAQAPEVPAAPRERAYALSALRATGRAPAGQA